MGMLTCNQGDVRHCERAGSRLKDTAEALRCADRAQAFEFGDTDALLITVGTHRVAGLSPAMVPAGLEHPQARSNGRT